MNLNTNNARQLSEQHLVKEFFKEVLTPNINLPNKVVFDVSCQFPTQIKKQIDYYANSVENFVLFNNHVWRYRNEVLEIVKNYPNKKFIVITAEYNEFKAGNNYIEIPIPSIYWCRKISNDTFIPKGKNLDYGFACLNNRPADHRLIFGYYLYKKNLLKDIIFVLNNQDCKYSSSLDSTEGIKYEFINARSYIKEKEFENFVELLPIKFKDNEIKAELFNIDNYTYLESYSHIVLETHVQEWPYSNLHNLPVITEKSFKPFMASQIPLFLAACGHLNFLENLGFEVFNDLYPKDFDNLHLSCKIDAIIDIVKRGKEFIKDFYFSNIKEIKHNYDLSMSDKIEKESIEKLRNIVFNL